MNPFTKNREPLTPAQKKVAAGVACIVLIVAASLAFDLLINGTEAMPVPEVPSVEQEAAPEGSETPADEEQPAEDPQPEERSDGPAEEGQEAYESLEMGKSYDAGDIVLTNGSDRAIGEEASALVGDLRTFLLASGIDYGGSEFTVVEFSSSPDTGAATFFLTSGVEGARYIQASRASSAMGFQVSTAADEAAFSALVGQAAADASGGAETPGQPGTPA